jgi:hypothetical protein
LLSTVGVDKVKPDTNAASKKPYTKPRLKIHGDLLWLTQVKGGAMGDGGGGKPATKASGINT